MNSQLDGFRVEFQEKIVPKTLELGTFHGNSHSLLPVHSGGRLLLGGAVCATASGAEKRA